jgi:hypothetical protein
LPDLVSVSAAGLNHVVAPDYPGSGYSDAPPESKFEPTFANLSNVVETFVKKQDLTPIRQNMADRV